MFNNSITNIKDILSRHGTIRENVGLVPGDRTRPPSACETEMKAMSHQEDKVCELSRPLWLYNHLNSKFTGVCFIYMSGLLKK